MKHWILKNLTQQTPSLRFFSERFAVLSLTLFSGCGAPLKTADQVGVIFKDVETLDQKMIRLCSELQISTVEPSLEGMSLANDACTKPNQNSENFSLTRSEIGFSDFTSESIVDPADPTKKLFKVKTRSQMWLRKSVLQLAQALFHSLKKKTETTASTSGGQTDSLNSIFTLKFIGDPVFDTKTFNFNVDFLIDSPRSKNGLVDILNEYTIKGKLLDKKYFGVTARTKAPQVFAKSIIKEGKMLILIVPHGGDVYLEIVSETNFHSFGVDSVMKTEIISTLGKGLKNIPELMTVLEKE